jgi:uncharacterized protein YpmS
MRHIKILLIILSLVGAALACNLPGRAPSADEAVTEPIPVTTEAVESLKEKMLSAEEQAQAGGEVELSLSETEVTSLVAFELAKNNPQLITDVQVYLRDGQVQVKGTYQDGDLSLPVSVMASPQVSSDGFVSITIDSAKVGPVSAPDVLRNQIQTLLDEQLAQLMTGQSGTEFRVSSIEIADGFITLRGSKP